MITTSDSDDIEKGLDVVNDRLVVLRPPERVAAILEAEHFTQGRSVLLSDTPPVSRSSGDRST